MTSVNGLFNEFIMVGCTVLTINNSISGILTVIIFYMECYSITIGVCLGNIINILIYFIKHKNYIDTYTDIYTDTPEDENYYLVLNIAIFFISLIIHLINTLYFYEKELNLNNTNLQMVVLDTNEPLPLYRENTR